MLQNVIQDFGINQFLSRRLNISDPAPAGALAPEVMPVLLATPPSFEDDYLRGVRIAAATAESSAALGQFGVIRLRNPGGSNMLVMVDRMYITPTIVNQNLAHGITNLDVNLANAITTGSRDGRIRPSAINQATQAIGSVEQGGVPGLAISGKILQRYFTTTVLATMLTIEPDVVLAPGQTFDICSFDTNAGFYVTFHWRERRVQPSELV